MNLQQLGTLIAIADQGGLSAAARTLGISQPAVTKQLQRLEQELETTLLLRSAQRQVAFTPGGTRVLAFARETLERAGLLREQLALLKEVTPGSLALSASTIPGEYLLPSLLAAFHARYPEVQLRSTVADTDEVARQLLAAEADIGFVGALPKGGRAAPGATGDRRDCACPAARASPGTARLGNAGRFGRPDTHRPRGGLRHAAQRREGAGLCRV